jgi:hypothetical protein
MACGPALYLRMAIALARSYKRWNDSAWIPFYLATDAAPSALPPDLADVRIIPLQPGQFGRGFSPKLHLDALAPAARALFIDADCLCTGSLEPAFATFAGHAVSVIGREISSGEWFGDVAAICRRLEIAAIPRFNGGVYYLETGPACSAVYATARALEPRYDELGFVRLRTHANDEVLVGAAMARHGQTPVPEKGDIMNSLLAGPGGVELDVLAGRLVMHNPRTHPRHNPWYELEELRPRLIHFLGGEIDEYPYHQEELRLALVCGKRWPAWLATAWTRLTFTWPRLLWNGVKDLLRPLFRAAGGTRAVQSSRGS